MDKIEVQVLRADPVNMPSFLAKLTQRGHEIGTMSDLCELWDATIDSKPSKPLLMLQHNTIKRMNYITVAVVGLSTKCVSQLRTHATRLTFLSTSTQYSAYDKRPDNWVVPITSRQKTDRIMLEEAYAEIENIYRRLLDCGIEKDIAGYVLPQGLRKALIISGHLDAWQYVLQTRLCHRNTQETQHVARLIYAEIEKALGPEFMIGMLPRCYYGKCEEGKFCCGKKFSEGEVYERL